MNTNKLLEQLKRHEGLELKAYLCPADKISIGFGRNLQDRGITESEAEYLLINDVKHFQQKLMTHQFYAYSNEVRRGVLINMAFNIGVSGLLKFKKTINFIEQQYFDQAASEMLDSKWAKQVGDRAIELSNQMREGV